MQCRNCGAEIADKALICYRCGTATSDAKYKPAPVRRRRSRAPLAITVLVIAILLLLLILYLRDSRAGPARLEPAREAFPAAASPPVRVALRRPSPTVPAAPARACALCGQFCASSRFQISIPTPDGWSGCDN
jgi:hypothetical protein